MTTWQVFEAEGSIKPLKVQDGLPGTAPTTSAPEPAATSGAPDTETTAEATPGGEPTSEATPPATQP